MPRVEVSQEDIEGRHSPSIVNSGAPCQTSFQLAPGRTFWMIPGSKATKHRPPGDRIERRMLLPVQIREIPDEIRQQFHVACLILVAADEAQFTGPVKPNFLRARQHVPGAIPRAAVTGVEPVARGSRVGESRVDMTLPIEDQVVGSPGESEFATVKRGTALRFGNQAGTGLAFDLGEDVRLLGAVHQSPQHGRLVVGLGDQSDKSTVIDGRDPHIPPRSAST